MLNLRFLAGLEVKGDPNSQPEIKTQKTLALICYLVLTNIPHHRSHLAGLLWPEMPESRARSNLRKGVGQLRLLKPHFNLTRDKVSFNSAAPFWCDVTEFELHVQKRQDIRHLEMAANLFQGDFLAGFYLHKAAPFEQWMMAQRTRLREEMLQALATLITYFGQGEQYGQAIDFARRLLAIEPWREDAQRDLMRYLALNGQRGAALAQYDLCRKLLWEELAVEPAAETQRLFAAIRDDQLYKKRATEIDLALPNRTGAEISAFEQLIKTADPPPFGDGVVADQVKEDPFVAREQELKRLMDLLQQAPAGSENMVFISGEAGAGKTSLIANFVQAAQKQIPDLLTARGACEVYTGIGEPYLPFRAILANLLGDVTHLWNSGAIAKAQAQKIWRQLPQTLQILLEQSPALIDFLVSRHFLEQQLAAYAALHPGQKVTLSALYDQLLQLPRQSVTKQDRVFAEFALFFEAVSARQPLLLVLDDLHWADLSSIGLLSFLSKRLAPMPVVIIGSYRPEDLVQAYREQISALQNLLNEWQRQSGKRMIDLDQAQSGRAFVDALIDSSPNALPTSFRQKLANLTGGQPLFTVEVLRDLEEREILQRDGEGQLVHSDVDWETVPARVEGIIARRIERLDDNLREALIIGCIEGEYFSAEVIARLLDLPVPLVVRRLSQELDRRHRLVRAQGIRSLAGKRRSIYQFRHNLFQTYLYEQLDDIERVYYHESVGTVLEGMAAGQVEEAAVELGYHFRKANQPEKAMRYLTLAGDAALNLHAYTEAVLQYQQAHNLIDRQQMEGASLTALTLKLGRALELNSQFAAAVDIYSELKVLARERSDKAMELAALSKRMTLQSIPSVAQDLAAAIADGDYALSLAQDMDDQKMEATIQGILTVAYSYTGQLDLAIEAGDRSLNLARQIDDQALLAQTLHDVGMLNFLIGRFLRSIALLEEAGELWRGMDNQPMLADALSSACVGYVYTGRFARADAHSEAAKFISETIDNTWGRSYSQYMIGIAHWERGRGGRAIAAMGECIEFATEANFLPGQTKGRSDLGIVYAELGNLRKGLQLAKLALEIAQANDSMDDRVRIVGQLVFVHILKGELELAQELIAEARSKLKLGYLVSGNPFLIAETELAFKLGDIKRAQANIGEVWGRINELDLWLYAPQMLLQQGRLQLLIGQELEARKSFTEARRIGEKIGSRRMLWRIYYQLSALAEDAGEKKRLRQQAQDLVHFIAQHSGSPELSVSFLNLPDVKQVLAERLAN